MYIYNHESYVALLAYLKVIARFENERIRIVRGHETISLNMHPQSEPSEASTNTLELVGPISWLYMRLSAYLFPPLSPSKGEVTPSSSLTTKTENHQVLAGDIDVANTTPIESKSSIVEKELLQKSSAVAQAEQLNQELAALPVEYKRDIYILGSLKVEVGKEGEKSRAIIIKSETQRDLFAYIATANKPITWENIDIDVYEPILSDKNTEQRKRRLEKDARHLRDLFRKASEQAGIPYIDPIIVEGKGPGAIWHLAADYQVKDITMLILLHGEIKAIKMGKAVDIQSLRELTDDVVMSYNHFLASELYKKEVINWAIEPYQLYREMFREIVWDLAKIEYEYGMRPEQHPEESKISFKRAALLWEKYAFIFIPQSNKELMRKGKARLSELALQEAMKMYLHAGDEQSAHRIFHSYTDLMKRRFPNFEPDSKTIEILSNTGLG